MKKISYCMRLYGAMVCLTCFITCFHVNAAAPTWDGSIDTTFAGGDGTEANPFQIATPAQLAYLAQQTNTTKEYSKDKYFILTDDIYLNDSVVGSDGKSLNSGSFKPWTRIGKETDGYYFYGHFDGQGHTVSGMYISNSSSYQGLFGCVSGTVKNIVFKDGYLHSGSISGLITGQNCAGALIDNCSTEGFVSIDSYERIGGIAGENYGTVQRCVNFAYIYGKRNSYGGIVGWLAADAAILHCKNHGEVYCSSYYHQGGICGSSRQALIAHCTNTGYIHNNDREAAGIVGWDENGTEISYCLNTGDVRGGYENGGIVGVSTAGTTIVHDCINKGNIYGSYKNGGIIGHSTTEAIIHDCINQGNVSGSSTDIGGIVGYISNLIIYNVWNSGNISGTWNVGGIVGLGRADITNALNSGDIKATYSSSSDGYKCGGIGANMNNTTITNSVNTGKINSSMSYTYAIGYASCNYNYSLKTPSINYSRSLVSSGENNTAFGLKQKLETPVTVGANNYKELLAALNAVVAEDTTGRYCQWAVEYGINGEFPYPVFARCAAPTITVDDDGNFSITADSAATIYYTTDGSTPTEESTIYSGSGKLTAACNLQAIAISPTKFASAVASYNYGLAATATPVITLNGKTATITCTDSDASIFYSTDGFDPQLSKTPYTAPIQLRAHTPVKAYAISEGKYPSATAETSLPQTVWDGTVDSTYSSGSGTEEDPYIIMTPGQLAWLSYNVNTFENYSKDIYYKLGDDIYLNEQIKYGDDYNICGNQTWAPIGYKNSDTHVLDFQGHFDGNGHTVHGIFYNNTSNESFYIGLFGRVYNAEIKNLTVEDVYIRGYRYCGGIIGIVWNSVMSHNSNASGFVYALGADGSAPHSELGGLFGSASSCQISYCSNSSYVNGNKAFVGGIIGWTSNSTLDYCINNGYIYSNHCQLGGIGGSINGGTTISHSDNYGDINGSTTYDNWAACGGIGGTINSSSSITACTNYGNVNNRGRDIGGIAGQCSSSSIKDCINHGSVQMRESYSNSGGIVGAFYSSTTSSCKNLGFVSGYGNGGGICGYSESSTVTLCNNYEKVKGTDNVGGVVGHNYGGTISYCQNSDSIIGSGTSIGGVAGFSKSGNTFYCHNTGYVQGYNCVGGINGTCYDSYVYICHNSGTVKTTSGTGGGIVGHAYYWYDIQGALFYNNYNKGIIDACGSAGGLIGDLYNYDNRRIVYVCNSYTTGDISGATDVGGLIGYYHGRCNTYIQNCYHTGQVSDATNKGELIGELDQYSNIDHCYFYYSDTAEINLVDKAVGYNNNAQAVWLRFFNDEQQFGEPNVIGDTTATDLLSALNLWASQNNYTPWAIDSSVNNGLPYLTSFICATPVITQDSGKFVLTSATSSARIYYTLDHSTPTENSTLYTGPINTSDYSYITAVAMADGFLPSAYATLDCFTTLYTYGDVNNDGHIRTGDVVSIVNYILKKTPEVFIYRAADVNKDSIIDISDAVNVVGLILGTYTIPDKETSVPSMVATYADSQNDLISGYGHGNSLAISLTNQKPYTAFQLDIDLPEGVSIRNATATQRANTSHSLSFNNIGNNTHRIVCFSMANSTFKDHTGKLLELELNGAEDLPEGTYRIPVSNIRMSDADGRSTALSDAVLTLSVGNGVTAMLNTESNGLIIKGGDCLTILSPESRDIRIYSIDGLQIQTIRATAGTTTKYSLPMGMYIVEGTKVTIVK